MRPTPEKISAFMAQLKKMNFKSLVITLAAIVVFTTTYLLVLPAFTLDKEEAAEQGGIDVAVEQTVEDQDAEDVFITATELNKDTEGFDYEQYKKDVLEALKKDSSYVEEIKSIRFYDITLESESQDDTVEPEEPELVMAEPTSETEEFLSPTDRRTLST